MKYVQPIGEHIDARYSNGNTQNGTLGSIIPAQAIEHPMREIVNVIEESGLTPDADDNEQLYKALRRLCAPAGEIRMWGGNHIPDGFLHCNGQAVNRTTYADLFAAIGTTHGSGNGSTTFNVPDIRDKFIIGSSNTREVGETGGAFTKTHTSEGTAITEAQMPSHRHALAQDAAGTQSVGTNSRIARLTNANNDFSYSLYRSNSGNDVGVTGNKGGGATHCHTITDMDVTPPYIAMIYIIKT